MILLKEESVKQADISKYKDMNVGYHAGDLGKSEFLGNQRGSNRGTGHFGTGTYFVGDIKNIQLSSYNERPLHVVDFSKYKLYKPWNYYDANNLHESLKYINSYHENYDERFWFIPSRDLDDLRYGEPEEIIAVLKKYIEDAEEQFVLKTEMTFENFLKSESMPESVHRYLDRLADALKERSLFTQKTRHKQFESLLHLSLNFHKSEETVLEIINDIFNNRIDKSWEGNFKKDDSASTIFIKEMGFEGIDVRHIKQMDNTMYGSVIYDVKPKTILE